jgi:hypothetical protein
VTSAARTRWRSRSRSRQDDSCIARERGRHALSQGRRRLRRRWVRDHALFVNASAGIIRPIRSANLDRRFSSRSGRREGDASKSSAAPVSGGRAETPRLPLPATLTTRTTLPTPPTRQPRRAANASRRLWIGHAVSGHSVAGLGDYMRHVRPATNLAPAGKPTAMMNGLSSQLPMREQRPVESVAGL